MGLVVAFLLGASAAASGGDEGAVAVVCLLLDFVCIGVLAAMVARGRKPAAATTPVAVQTVEPEAREAA